MAFENTNTADDVSMTVELGGGGSTQPALTMGWVKPVSLATGAYFAASSATAGMLCRTGASNSALLEVVNERTTPDIWQSSESIFANGQWTFFACAYNAQTTTDTASCLAWAGIGLNQPTKLTMTQTQTGVGNIGSGNTTWMVGCKSALTTVPLIGVIEIQAILATGAATTTTSHIWQVATEGALSAETENILFYRFVLPFWSGRIKVPEMIVNCARNTVGSLQYNVYQCTNIPVSTGGGVVKRAAPMSNAASFVAIGYNSAPSAVCNERGPRAYAYENPQLLWRRR